MNDIVRCNLSINTSSVHVCQMWSTTLCVSACMCVFTVTGANSTGSGMCVWNLKHLKDDYCKVAERKKEKVTECKKIGQATKGNKCKENTATFPRIGTTIGMKILYLPNNFCCLQPLWLQTFPGVYRDPVRALCGQSGHLQSVAGLNQSLFLIAITHRRDDALNHSVPTYRKKGEAFVNKFSIGEI